MPSDAITARAETLAAPAIRDNGAPAERAGQPHAAFLRANSEAYEWQVGKLRAQAGGMDAEAILRGVRGIANFATEFHPGRFSDGAIENLAFAIGASLDRGELPPGSGPLAISRKDGRRRVLHVTPALALGGHGPLLRHWIRHDTASCHSLALVNQPGEVPGEWRETIRGSGGRLAALPPTADLVQKARWLRALARRTADLVVVHTIWPDVVPTVAFAGESCPPVVVIDHADHLFWLGGSVADLLVNLRTVGTQHTAARRGVQRHAVLPIPLLDAADPPAKPAARQALGIGADEVVLLSVGRGVKYRPCGDYDFVATANRLLERHADAHLYVVGESAAGIAPYLRVPAHARLHFLGRIDDPSLYRAAADLYLESFPYGSQTALLEAALSALPVVPAYAPLAPTLVANDDALADLLPNPCDEQDYMQRAAALIGDPGQRLALGQEARRRLLAEHMGSGWLDRLAGVYREAERLPHRPRPIPVSRCVASATDIGLSLWQAMAGGRSETCPEAPWGDAKAVLYHAALAAKEAGHYALARRFAWRALRQAPSRCEHWRLFLIALLGRKAVPLRRALLGA